MLHAMTTAAKTTPTPEAASPADRLSRLEARRSKLLEQINAKQRLREAAEAKHGTDPTEANYAALACIEAELKPMVEELGKVNRNSDTLQEQIRLEARRQADEAARGVGAKAVAIGERRLDAAEKVDACCHALLTALADYVAHGRECGKLTQQALGTKYRNEFHAYQDACLITLPKAEGNGAEAGAAIATFMRQVADALGSPAVLARHVVFSYAPTIPQSLSAATERDLRMLADRLGVKRTARLALPTVKPQVIEPLQLHAPEVSQRPVHTTTQVKR